MRFATVCFLLSACGATAHGPVSEAVPAADDRAADADELWQFVDETYPFGDKPIDWNAAKDRYRERARAATDRHALVRAFEDMLDEVYDAHSHLGTNYDDSWQLVAHDLWAEWQGGKAIIQEVRRDSAASAAGLVAGLEIESIDGVPVRAATDTRMPHFLRSADPVADEWALNSILGGRHDRGRVIIASGKTYNLAVDAHGSDEPLVSHRMLDAEVGYIRIAGFGDEAVVAQFDAALEAVKSAKALVIDVRDNPGGDTAYALPMLGRLLDKGGQYASMSRREGRGMSAHWSETVEPRGPWTFRGPVVVVINHWSESMAEGFAMAIDGLHRGVLVGTRMAGLDAGVARRKLAHSQIPVQISAEPVFHVDGRPRGALRPAVTVDLAARKDDAILEAGLATAKAAISRRP